MVLSAKTVAESLRVDWLSKVPWVSMSSTATFLPSGLSTRKTSLQIWIPVVSLSEPPLQENPVRGSSLSPSQSSDAWGRR